MIELKSSQSLKGRNSTLSSVIVSQWKVPCWCQRIRTLSCDDVIFALQWNANMTKSIMFSHINLLFCFLFIVMPVFSSSCLSYKSIVSFLESFINNLVKLLGFDCKIQACKAYKHKHDIPVINDLFEVSLFIMLDEQWEADHVSSFTRLHNTQVSRKLIKQDRKVCVW